MRLAFTSIVGSGVDTNVRSASRWLVGQGHIVYIVYVHHLPVDLEQHPDLHFYVARPSYRFRLLSKVASRWSRLRVAVDHFGRSVAFARALRKIRVDKGFDLAELNELNFHPELLQNIGFVYKMHGADWLFSRYCEDSTYYTGQMRRQRKMMTAARQIHVVSRSQAAFVSGSFMIPPRLIQVTPNPIDIGRYQQISGRSDGPPFSIMTVGRIESRKGYATLARAMHRVWTDEPQVRLTIFKGRSSSQIRELESLLAEAGGRVSVVGYVSDEELLTAYQQTHLYVTAARYETFGYTILEAMACGRPVIATDIGPIPELVRHEETGWLVPRDDADALAEAILFALRHPELREAYGRAGRKVAEKYDVNVVMERQVRLYEQALNIRR